MMPLYQSGAFGVAVSMALATLFGMGFGFVLERAGFARSDVLSAQFFGTDMRVLKVMFTAIATVAIGLGALSGLGAVDLTMLKIPETFLGPQVVGGLLLGVGFVISGYCPGTAVVAAGSGYTDALWSLLGVAVGSLAFGFAYPALEGFYGSGAQGVVTLPTLLGIPWTVLAVGVLVMAVGSFLFGEWVERKVSAARGHAAPAGSPRVRNGVFGVLGAVASVGLVTLALPAPSALVPERPAVATIDAVDLAQRIAGGEDLYVVDLRSPADCARASVPGATCLTADDATAEFVTGLTATRTLVVIPSGATATLPAAITRYEGTVRVLPGGYEAFKAAILDRPVPPVVADQDAVGAYRLRAALHGYFTGSAAPAAPPPATVAPKARATKKGGGC